MLIIGAKSIVSIRKPPKQTKKEIIISSISFFFAEMLSNISSIKPIKKNPKLERVIISKW